MARKTKCLTPHCMYSTHINDKEVSISVRFPKPIKLSKKESALLEDLLHNSVECVLRPYFMKERVSKRDLAKKVLKGVINALN